jgi:cytochrome P450
LAEELERVLDGRTPTLSDLPNLPYVERVVKESMRLYPPAWVVGREAIAECEVGGYRMSAGTTALMSQWVMHRDPRYHEVPERFDPDRWTAEYEKALPRFAYFPFGGGPGSVSAQVSLWWRHALSWPQWLSGTGWFSLLTRG